jgi:hypothetical protein
MKQLSFISFPDYLKINWINDIPTVTNKLFETPEEVLEYYSNDLVGIDTFEWCNKGENYAM